MRRILLTSLLMLITSYALGDDTAASQTTPLQGASDAPTGVQHPQLAWQHWVLNCQGCHREDGTGSTGTAPSLAGAVAKFTRVPGGREYLGRVPGVATAPLADADLAELLNWTLWRFDRAHLSPQFQPYTAAEIAALRRQPLRTEASQVRARLLGGVRQSSRQSSRSGHENP